MEARNPAPPEVAEKPTEIRKPVFDARSFTIEFLATRPEGFDVYSRSIRRREKGSAYPLTEEQKSELKQGMRGEVAFALKRNGLYSDEIKQESDPRKQWDMMRKVIAENAIDLREELGHKIGIRNVKLEGNTLVLDAKLVSFPVYPVTTGSEESQENHDLGAVTGTAAILTTADNKLILQHRSSSNAIYGDIPGASAAGMFDARILRHVEGNKIVRTGTPVPIDTRFVKDNALAETRQEVALDFDFNPEKSDISDFRIVGVAHDKVRVHYEFLLLGKTKLTAREVAEKARNAPRSKKREGDFHFEEKFVVIDATPEAIEVLLAEVKCPLPPTHAAAFIAAGYNMVLEREGGGAAEAWKDSMQQKVKRNYEEMDKIVQKYYEENPAAFEEVPVGKPKRNPKGYEPSYTPERQGLPSFKSEVSKLQKVGLIELEVEEN